MKTLVFVIVLLLISQLFCLDTEISFLGAGLTYSESNKVYEHPSIDSKVIHIQKFGEPIYVISIKDSSKILQGQNWFETSTIDGKFKGWMSRNECYIPYGNFINAEDSLRTKGNDDFWYYSTNNDFSVLYYLAGISLENIDDKAKMLEILETKYENSVITTIQSAVDLSKTFYSETAVLYGKALILKEKGDFQKSVILFDKIIESKLTTLYEKITYQLIQIKILKEIDLAEAINKCRDLIYKYPDYIYFSTEWPTFADLNGFNQMVKLLNESENYELYVMEMENLYKTAPSDIIKLLAISEIINLKIKDDQFNEAKNILLNSIISYPSVKNEYTNYTILIIERVIQTIIKQSKDLNLNNELIIFLEKNIIDQQILKSVGDLKVKYCKD